MRIRLRPYHPTWVVAFYGAGGMKAGHNKRGFDYVLDQLKTPAQVEVQLVECYDDICQRCDRLRKSDGGSLWGERQTCTSAENPKVVESVKTSNRQALERLGLAMGDVIGLRKLVALLRERIPDLAASGIAEIGGASIQAAYARGLAELSKTLGDSRDK